MLDPKTGMPKEPAEVRRLRSLARRNPWLAGTELPWTQGHAATRERERQS
jgi:hypothetical protein